MTADGGEIGRAQALQALACRTPASGHMNPVLLKPQSDVGAQLVVRGKMRGNWTAANYQERKTSLLEHISHELNWGIPKAFLMGESARVNSFMEANDAEAMFPGSARALDRSRRIWRVAT